MQEETNEMILSTHDESGKPKFKALYYNSFAHIVGGMFFFGLFIYFYFNVSKGLEDIGFNFIKYISFFFLLFGFVFLYVGLKNLSVKVTVVINSMGISITSRNKNLFSSWNEVSEVLSTQTVIPYSRHVDIIRNITIKTYSWKFKLTDKFLPLQDLKKLFIRIAEYAYDNQIKVVDYLGWLPDDFRFDNGRTLGNIAKKKEYKRYFFIGLLMIISGLFVMSFGIFNTEGNAFPILGVVLLFIGLMLLISGGIGFIYYKGKE